MVTDPLCDWLPENVPPMSLDSDAAQDVAFADVHESLTACPTRIVAACVGDVNETDGMGA
ncbi:MAG TPA: hypothetical protein VHE11_00995 [Steroidobacteraceae bacterium]|nr:hypothetical protein [Steroidobacteraceae bacterium]